MYSRECCKKLDPNQPDKYGATPLGIAIYYADIIAIKMLLGHPKIDLNKATREYGVSHLVNPEVLADIS